MPGSNIQNPGSSIQEEVTERGVRKFSALKKTESQTWGGNADPVPVFVDSVFSSSGKNRIHKKWGLFFFHGISPPCLGLCFFFRAEIFGLLSPSLHLICWSQGFGYCFLASYGIIICTRPTFLKTLLQKRATYSTFITGVIVGPGN